ncbi:hypothetical protein ACFU67_12945 [Streptomyces rhizosphaericola]|uniref:hypothetical protein n=1 Tax=Streptomyces rhizosphaericola TaxID=2564098 RepID=UPI0036B1289B
MNIPWGDIATIALACIGLTISIAAWRAASRSADEAKRSADSAENVARIERERWHADQTPVFKAKLVRQEGDRAQLDFQLVGPLSLQHLDRIELTIANSDDLVRSARLAGSRPQEELDAQVWGPYRFGASADGADATGKTVEQFALEVGRGRPFSLERTRPPHWQEGDDRDRRWAAQFGGKPVRLLVHCRKDGVDPWVVPVDVEMPPPPPMAAWG